MAMLGSLCSTTIGVLVGICPKRGVFPLFDYPSHLGWDDNLTGQSFSALYRVIESPLVDSIVLDRGVPGRTRPCDQVEGTMDLIRGLGRQHGTQCPSNAYDQLITHGFLSARAAQS